MLLACRPEAARNGGDAVDRGGGPCRVGAIGSGQAHQVCPAGITPFALDIHPVLAARPLAIAQSWQGASFHEPAWSMRKEKFFG